MDKMHREMMAPQPTGNADMDFSRDATKFGTGEAFGAPRPQAGRLARPRASRAMATTSTGSMISGGISAPFMSGNVLYAKPARGA